MTIIGRITKDAVVKQLKDEKKVVEFSVAINDYYKPKDGAPVQLTTYVNCAYWINTAIAERLRKGSLAEVDGRMSVNAYINHEGKARASLNFHVDRIKMHAVAKADDTATVKQASGGSTAPGEDLPF